MQQSCRSLRRLLQSQIGTSDRSLAAQVAARRLHHHHSSFPRSENITSAFRKSPAPVAPRLPFRRHRSDLAVSGQQQEPVQDLQPAYQLTFTCKPCGSRSAHRVTKQGYHHGTTLITCPDCKNRHLISDHLKIFSDSPLTLEDIMHKKLSNGQPLSDLLKKGKLGIRQGAIVGMEGEEDLEFWEDGTETTHEKAA